MAKLKKLLIGALSMCMAVSMAACGNTGNGDNSNGIFGRYFGKTGMA